MECTKKYHKRYYQRIEGQKRNDEFCLKAYKQGLVEVNPKTGIIFGYRVIQWEDKVNGYIIVSIPNGKKKVKVRAHRLIWIAGHGIPKNERNTVHHKNNIKTDNRIENLEVISDKKHSKINAKRAWFKKMQDKAHKSSMKPLLRIDDGGIVLQEYNSIQEAIDKHGINRTSLSYAMKRDTFYQGFKWSLKNEQN